MMQIERLLLLNSVMKKNVSKNEEQLWTTTLELRRPLSERKKRNVERAKERVGMRLEIGERCKRREGKE